MTRFEEAAKQAEKLKYLVTPAAKHQVQRMILATLLLGLRGR